VFEPEAAVAIVETRAQSPSILLMRRADRAGDPWSGHWSFPGGRREIEDTDLVATALRELDEECGIQLGRSHLEASLPPGFAGRRAGLSLCVAPFVFRTDTALPVVPDPREAVEAVWVPLNFLRDPARHAFAQVAGLPADVWFPSIDLNGVPLWGFTYRLIADWLSLNPPPGKMTEAGFKQADVLLDFLIAAGLPLRHTWELQGNVNVAEVGGVIPVSRVWEHIRARAPQIPQVNALEIQPGIIRVVGLAFEEYLIQARPSPQTSI
jgi:8-oxo-dGTP pyrophosphatase MutT (NUDIX family)